MARYRYMARDYAGKSVEAVLEAPNEDALERLLTQQGMTLVAANEVGAKGGAASKSLNLNLSFSFAPSPSLTQKELVLFTMELGTSYRAGLPILGTLEDMANTAEAAAIRKVSAGVADRVRGGDSLADSMRAYPKAFPTLYVELVTAAEQSGQLDRVLDDLVRFLEWQRVIKGQVKSATTYPAALLGVTVTVVVVLTVFVFPKFLESFSGMGAELPLPTRILMRIDELAKAYGQMAVGTLFGIVALYFAIRNHPPVRWQIDMAKLKMPAIGKLLTKVLMSRFSHNLAMMLASGLEFSQSLRICEKIMGNVVLGKLVQDARVAIEQGEALSDAMARGGYIPSLVRRMLKLGESTGKMEETLEHVSKYYDDEVPEAIKSTFAVIQPVMLIFMAGIVLFMAAAVFMPIYQMLELLGGD